MSRYAILSDIHGNRHALEAVLRAICELESEGPYEGIICLGDIVGYGPAPGTCLDLVTKYCTTIVRGNHDEAALDLTCAATFNGPARDAIKWTSNALTPMHRDGLNRMPCRAYVDDDIMCVHDCPIEGPTDYVHDEYIAAQCFLGIDRWLCLLGHTHVPMIFTAPAAEGDDPDAMGAAPADAAPKNTYADGESSPPGISVPAMTCVRRIVPMDNEPIALDRGMRYICNPGSVGQPRDADPRAAFAILDMEALTFTLHRRAYDIDAAQRDTEQAGLPAILGQRLAVGA